MKLYFILLLIVIILLLTKQSGGVNRFFYNSKFFNFLDLYKKFDFEDDNTEFKYDLDMATKKPDLNDINMQINNGLMPFYSSKYADVYPVYSDTKTRKYPGSKR